MRMCIRCNTEMVEGCGIKVEGGAYRIILIDDEKKFWGGRIDAVKVAICPKCGEVSMYLEDVEKLRKGK